ncbi:MAG: metallophosphoesterase family protein [Pseudomonadota bacterium]
MLEKIFTQSSQRLKEHRARVPDGQRVYAIGDIHGRLDLLDALLEKIDREHDACGKHDAVQRTIIFLGDYVDRGPDSHGVLARLSALSGQQTTTNNAPTKAGTKYVFLKGNHEAAMLSFLDTPRTDDRWLDWGGSETLESYGIDGAWHRASRDLSDDLRAALPDDHRALLDSLELYHQIGDYVFVHAGVKPGVALSDQAPEDLLWIRDVFHNAAPEERPQETIVHGHEPGKRPVNKGWRIGIDTGAVWTGVLTAVVLEKHERRFLTVDGPASDDWINQ